MMFVSFLAKTVRAQSAERGADNAKVVSSTLTRTTTISFPFSFLLRGLKNILKMMLTSFLAKTVRAPES